jgi:hypothetical protein
MIDPQFDWATGFGEGLSRVKFGGKQGYIDRAGKYVWQPAK